MLKSGFKLTLLLSLLIFQAALIRAQVPRLRVPENDRVIGGNQVLLRWSLLNATQFDLEVAEDAAFTTNLQSISALTQNFYLLSNLVPGQDYFWRVRSSQPSGNFSQTRHFSVFRPTLIDSCQLWLRADTGVTLDAGLVSTWQDSSPNQLLVSQTNAALQPSLLANAFNQLPALNFDGTDRFAVPGVNFGDDNTGFIIAKNNPGANPFTRVFMGGYNYNFDFFPDACQIQVGFITTGAHNADTLSQITLLRQPGNSRAYKNGVQTGPTYTNALTTMAPGNLFIGNRNDLARPLFGQISEILIYNIALGDNDRSLIENYLLWKYSPDLFLGNDTLLTQSLCPFTLSASPEFNRYVWSTGDTIATIQISASGTYSLQARDYFGRWHQDSIVVEFPQINQISDQTLCIGNNFVWSSNVSPSLNTVWSNGLIAPSITIDTAGFYAYEISDANGCSLRSDTIVVSIDNFSQVGTLGNDTALCEGNLLSILNQTAPLSGVLWSTGVNTEQIPIFAAGTYWVQAINTNNCIVNDTVVVSIGGIAPLVNFSFTTVCEGNAVVFTDLSVPSAGDVISAWEWDFGNNNFSNQQNPSFTFPDSGSFPVSLKTIVNTGCANISTQLVEVISKPNADFYTLNICDNAAAPFFENANAYNGQIVSWLWNFGDPASGNNTSTLQQPQHLFSSMGSFNVQLVVENLQGCTDTIVKGITVKPSPLAETTTLDPCERDATRILDVSDIPFPWQLLQRKWTLWDGSVSANLEIGADSLPAGNYPISLYILASNGCSDTLLQQLEIFPHPQAAYQLISPCVGTPTQLLNTSSCQGCTIEKQSWFLQQQFAGDSALQQVVLSDTTLQTIQLMVENNFGCTDTLVDTFFPGNKPLAFFSIINPVVGQGDPVILNNLCEGANQYAWNLGDGNSSDLMSPEYFYADTGSYSITLSAINSQFCTDTFSLGLLVRKQMVNLAIEELSYSVDASGFIRPEIRVRNLGTRLERKFNIEINAALESSMREEWTGLLLPGQSQQYKLKSSFLADTATQNFFCLSIISQDQPDDADLSNNRTCINYGFSESLVIGNIFPNPVRSSFQLPLLSQDEGSCLIQLIDQNGKLIFEVNALLNPGLNLVSVAPPPLPSGSYNLLVNRGGQIRARALLFFDAN